MGPTWGRQDPGGSHFGPMNLAIRAILVYCNWAPRNKINSSSPIAAYMRQWIGSALIQIMACRLFGAMPLSEPVLEYCQMGTNFSEIVIRIQTFSFKKTYMKISSAKWCLFCFGLNVLIQIYISNTLSQNITSRRNRKYQFWHCCISQDLFEYFVAVDFNPMGIRGSENYISGKQRYNVLDIF